MHLHINTHTHTYSYTQANSIAAYTCSFTPRLTCFVSCWPIIDVILQALISETRETLVIYKENNNHHKTSSPMFQRKKYFAVVKKKDHDMVIHATGKWDYSTIACNVHATRNSVQSWHNMYLHTLRQQRVNKHHQD